MDRESLLQKQAAINGRFDEVKKSVTDGEDELKRLQGEYRVISELLYNLTDPATTITAEPEEKKNGRK